MGGVKIFFDLLREFKRFCDLRRGSKSLTPKMFNCPVLHQSISVYSLTDFCKFKKGENFLILKTKVEFVNFIEFWIPYPLLSMFSTFCIRSLSLNFFPSLYLHAHLTTCISFKFLTLSSSFFHFLQKETWKIHFFPSFFHFSRKKRASSGCFRTLHARFTLLLRLIE